MAGLLDFLSPALTVATQAAGASEGAQATVAKQKKADLIQQAVMERQAQEDRIKQAMADRQARSAGLQDQLTGVKINQGQYALDHPAPTKYSPEYFQGMSKEEGIKEALREKYRNGGASSDPSAKRKAYILHNLPGQTKAKKDPLTGLLGPGLSRDEAIQQLGEQYDAVNGPTTSPVSPPARTTAPPVRPKTGRDPHQDAYDTETQQYQETLKALEQSNDPAKAQKIDGLKKFYHNRITELSKGNVVL